MSVRALIAVADGVEELECVTLIDVLRRAEVEVLVAMMTILPRFPMLGIRSAGEEHADRLPTLETPSQHAPLSHVLPLCQASWHGHSAFTTL